MSRSSSARAEKKSAAPARTHPDADAPPPLDHEAGVAAPAAATGAPEGDQPIPGRPDADIKGEIRELEATERAPHEINERWIRMKAERDEALRSADSAIAEVLGERRKAEAAALAAAPRLRELRAELARRAAKG